MNSAGRDFNNSVIKRKNKRHCEGRCSFSQNFQFQIPEIVHVKRKGFLHEGEKLAIGRF